MKILFVSNGYGEDQIACNLIQALINIDSYTEITVLPLVGVGLEYKKHGYTPIIENRIMPSNGFVRSFNSLLKDMLSGTISQHLKQLYVVHNISKDCDATFLVGDVFCLVMGSFLNKSKKIFLPTAKSDLFMKHGFLEKVLIKILANQVYTRDSHTAKSLKKFNIPASFLGNPMMDGFEFSETQLFATQSPVVGIAPGSREEAYLNLKYILKVLVDLDKKNDKLTYVLAKSKTISLEQLEAVIHEDGWIVKKTEKHSELKHKDSTLSIVISENFADVIAVSNVIIGLAGTANEQAVFFGRPIICFEGFGPQSTPLRFMEQKKLLGNLLFFVKNRTIENIINQINYCLENFNNKLEHGNHNKFKASYKVIKDSLY